MGSIPEEEECLDVVYEDMLDVDDLRPGPRLRYWFEMIQRIKRTVSNSLTNPKTSKNPPGLHIPRETSLFQAILLFQIFTGIAILTG